MIKGPRMVIEDRFHIPFHFLYERNKLITKLSRSVMPPSYNSQTLLGYPLIIAKIARRASRKVDENE